MWSWSVTDLLFCDKEATHSESMSKCAQSGAGVFLWAVHRRPTGGNLWARQDRACALIQAFWVLDEEGGGASQGNEKKGIDSPFVCDCHGALRYADLMIVSMSRTKQCTQMYFFFLHLSNYDMYIHIM